MDNDKKRIILKNALNSDNTPNIMLYPKYSKNILKEIFSDIYTIKNYNHFNKNDIFYTKTNIYYEFDMKNIINKNLETFTEILKEIIITKNHYSNLKYKIIIFNNFNHIKLSLQNILRVIIEKYRQTSLFICITDKLNSIIDPLKSRFLCLRINPPNKKQIRKIIYENSDKKLKNAKYYDFMYSLEKKKDIIISTDYEKQINKFLDIYYIISEEILKIINKKNIKKENYIELRNIVHNILKYNININKFYKTLLDILLKDNKIRDIKKYKLIRYFADSQMNFIQSYRKSIIIESLLINIHHTIIQDLF